MSLDAVIAVYATRYALGRRTGAPDDVLKFIQIHRDSIMSDTGCREAILRDIRKSGCAGEQEWRNVLATLDGATEEGA